MPVFVGGAELNVAQALAQWQLPVKYGTALPNHYLSEEIIQFIKAKKIDSSAIHLGGERIGVYYLPQGADLKNAGVIYDRAHSAFAALKPGIINWKEVLKNCSWFHFSAISPALNEAAAAVCEEALKTAKALGLKISVDLNYRAKLWQYGKQPVAVMPQLVSYCDVIMGNLWAAEALLGVPSPVKDSVGKTNIELAAAAKESMQYLQTQFTQVKTMAYTFRLDNRYWAYLQHGQQQATAKELTIENVVDKVGSGDCFMAGLIYGLVNNHAADSIINFAATAAVGKLYEKGDATQQTVAQIQQRLV
jgi:2-dehydro-3-deoxygluconokinase